MQQINCKDKLVRIEGRYRFYETGQFRRYIIIHCKTIERGY